MIRISFGISLLSPLSVSLYKIVYSEHLGHDKKKKANNNKRPAFNCAFLVLVTVALFSIDKHDRDLETFSDSKQAELTLNVSVTKQLKNRRICV